MAETDPRAELSEVLEDAVARAVFPGCVAMVVRESGVVYHRAHGRLASHAAVAVRDQPVGRDTIYDLASLTKVLCTTSLACIGVSEGWLDLGAAVPEPWRSSCAGASMSDLLEHCAGLPAHREYFTEVARPGRDQVLARVAAETPERRPRERAIYSDLGFMILGAWIERAADRPLDELFRERVANPLGLDDAVLPKLGFRSIARGALLDPAVARRIAPTEVYDRALHPHGPPSHMPVRDHVLCAHGEVHDDNAWIMDGVAGHAGLFGTAAGVVEVARAWLENALPGLEPAVRDRFWRPSKVTGSSRRLGWDGPEPDGSGSTGATLSPGAVGHTGFTGTSLWIDQARPSRILVLLSNAVHPVRNPDSIRAFRRRFHEAAARL